MENLRKNSRRLQLTVLVIMALIPVFFVLNILLGNWVDLLKTPQTISVDTSMISGKGLLAVVAVSSIKPAANMIALWFLYKLLSLYKRGSIFTDRNVKAIFHVGCALMFVNIAGMIQTVITGPILTVCNITSGYITVQLEVDFLVVGIFIVLVSHLTDIDMELKE